MGSRDCDGGDIANTFAANQGQEGRQRHLFPHLVILVVSASPCLCLCPSQAGTFPDYPSLIVTFFCSQHSAKALGMVPVRLINKWLGCGNLCSSLRTKAALSCVPELGRSQATRAAVASHRSKSKITLGQQQTLIFLRLFLRAMLLKKLVYVLPLLFLSLFFWLFLWWIQAQPML